ncbi:MAG: YidC/Oxa1 family membrane protein insertase, partial [Oscillospiraceae bacterium]
MTFSSIVTYPFAWLLLTLYDFTMNYGVAIFLFALIVKLVLLPFQMKSKRSMMRTTRLTPIMKELEKKHEGNKQKYQEEVARLYKEEK